MRGNIVLQLGDMVSACDEYFWRQELNWMVV